MTAKRSQILATVTTNPQSTQPLMLAANLPTAYVGTPWIGTVWGVGGAGGNVYSSITVPAWATASTVTILGIPIVQITGTPTSGTLGSNVVTVTVTDSSTTATTKQFRFNVTYAIAGPGGQLSVSAAPQTAYTNNPYSLDLKTYLNNPTLPLTSTVLTTGTLPTGVSITSSTNGIVSASSVTGTSQTVVITVTDGAGQVVALHLKFTVKPGLSASTYAPAGIIGQPYQGKVTVSGGSGSYSVQALAANPLPAGLAVAKSGDITGQPTALTPTTGAPTTHFQITDLVTSESITTTALGGGSKSIVIGSGVAPTTAGRFYVAGPTGPTDVDYLGGFFGGGSDNDLTINGSNNPTFAPLSSGYNTAQRDIYAHNLTISGTGKLNLDGHRLFVSGVLDISNAAAGSIVDQITSGSALPGNFSTKGGIEGNGATTNGAAGSSAARPLYSIGKCGGAGGAGGHGSGTNTGGAGGALVTPSLGTVRPIALQDSMIGFQLDPTSPTFSVWTVYAGIGGGGGGGGGGNGTNAGGRGSGGADGGGYVCIFARTINRGASTAAGAIDVSGGTGVAGLNATGGITQGGGGGAGGGAGGLVRIYYGNLTGASASNAIKANGGAGGAGGNRTGTAPATTGSGAQGGDGGLIVLSDLLQGITTIVDGTSGSFGSGQTGGNGGVAQASL